MSLRLQMVQGNLSRDSADHLWAANTSIAIGAFGTSRDQYGVVRTIAYSTSGTVGFVARFNEFSNGSRQYYQFVMNPTGNYAALEQVNVSTNWSTPTLIQSRSYPWNPSTSTRMSLVVTAVNASQDRVQGFLDDVGVIDYIGSLSVSSGKFGVMCVDAEVRFDRNTVIGEEKDYYCSIQSVQDLLKGLGISAISDEGEIQGLISRASQYINQQTGSVFGRLEKVTGERHQGGGEVSIIVEHTPLRLLSSIAVYDYNNSLVDTFYESDDSLIVDAETGQVTLPAKNPVLTPLYGVGMHPVETRDYYTFTEYDYSQYFGIGRKNIVVNYLYGYLDIPHSIWDACRKHVGIELLTKIGNYNTKGASMLRLGDAMEDYRTRGTAESGSMPFIGTILAWKKDIADTLEEYNSLLMESI